METKLKLFLPFMMMLWCIYPNHLSAKSDPTTPKANTITIIKREPIKTRPRGVVQPQIICVYDSTFQTLHFQFLEDLGDSMISISNTTSSEMFYGVNTSTSGICDIEISGETGSYTIYIEDENGQVYDGFFEL
ncbi:MAG: hypothetical protein NC548_30165 [Lachnospiraceae bacterium]|nr:hypothetical protein [Lachnospiraceae bacterium]